MRDLSKLDDQELKVLLQTSIVEAEFAESMSLAQKIRINSFY